MEAFKTNGLYYGEINTHFKLHLKSKTQNYTKIIAFNESLALRTLYRIHQWNWRLFLGWNWS